MKFYNTAVVFQEVPDEISLAVNITNCPNKCIDCHSKYLWDNVGYDLTKESISNIICDIGINYITCVCFMGGDRNPEKIDLLCKYIKERFKLKTAWYSGKQEISDKINLENFDYIKIGPYIKEKGGLNKITTNQIFYKIQNGNLKNINHKFIKK